MSIKIYQSINGKELRVPAPGNTMVKTALMDPAKWRFLQSIGKTDIERMTVNNQGNNDKKAKCPKEKYRVLLRKWRERER